MDKIAFTADDGSVEYYHVLAEATLGDMEYLLVADSMDDGANALLLRHDPMDDAGDVTAYDTVEDESEFAAACKAFEEVLGDISFEFE